MQKYCVIEYGSAQEFNDWQTCRVNDGWEVVHMWIEYRTLEGIMVLWARDTTPTENPT